MAPKSKNAAAASATGDNSIDWKQVPGGFKPGPHFVKCPTCSKQPKFAASPLKGFFFNPAKGMCPSHSCTFIPKANTKTFADLHGNAAAPAPDAAPSKRTPAQQAKLDAAAAKDKKALEAKLKKVEAENAKLKKGGTAQPAKNGADDDEDGEADDVAPKTKGDAKLADKLQEDIDKAEKVQKMHGETLSRHARL